MIFRLFRLFTLTAALALLMFGAGAQQPLPIPQFAGNSTPVHALTLNADASGQVTVAGYAAANVRGTLTPETPERYSEAVQAGQDRDFDFATVQLMDDRSGAVVYQTVVPVAHWIRGEFASGGEGIDGHFIARQNRTFVVKVPQIDGANRLAVSLPGSATRDSGIIDLAAVAGIFGARGTRSGLVRTDIAMNGDAANRVDVVILGDGYTAAQQADFEADAQALAAGLFGFAPYSTYAEYFNVVAIFGESAESGADQPVCPDTSLPMSGAYKDTRYDSTYCYDGIARLMVATDEAAIYADATAEYPDWDEIFLVANDEVYGGSGGAIAALARSSPAGFALSPLAVQILQHEVGHSLIRLDDEYSTSQTYPPCSDMGRGGITTLCRPNVTDRTVKSQIKWSRWFLPSTTVPTSGPAAPDFIGLWLGAHYSYSTYYRPCYNCTMRTLGQPFGPVASEQLPIVLYSGGWEGEGSYWGGGLGGGGGIDIIEPDTVTPDPSAGTVSIAGGDSQVFAFTVMSPAGGANTRVRWKIGDVLAQESLYAHGDTASFTFTPVSAGTTSVSAEVTEVAGVLHASQVQVSRSTLTWTVAAEGYRGVGAELVVNGSFETPSSKAKFPAGWTLTNAANFKRKCDGGAFEGSCAFMLGGTAGLTAVAAQKPPDTGDAGDAFSFSGQFDSVNLTGAFSAQVKMTFSGGAVKKLKLNGLAVDAANAQGYILHETGLILGIDSPDVTKIKIQLNFVTPGGKVYVDALSLQHYDEYLTSPPSAGGRRDSLLPPPPPPDALRGSN